MSEEYTRGYNDGYRDAEQSYRDGYRDASELWRNKTLRMEQQLEAMIKNASEIESMRPHVIVIREDTDETKPE